MDLFALLRKRLGGFLTSEQVSQFGSFLGRRAFANGDWGPSFAQGEDLLIVIFRESHGALVQAQVRPRLRIVHLAYRTQGDTESFGELLRRQKFCPSK